MTGPRARTSIATAAAAGLLAGCHPNSAHWFDPDWDRIVRDEGTEGRIPEELVPQPQIDDPPIAPHNLPDFAAPGPLELSVEQAVMLALTRNRDLSVARLSPVVAGAFEQIERGLFDPELFAEGSFTREEALETARATGEQFSVVADSSSLGAGVRQLLPSGTNVELGVTQDRDISNRAPEQQTARLGLTVTQSLLRGFGPAVNLAAVRQAQLAAAASRYELRGFLEALLAETEIAYWHYALAQRKIETFQRALEVARQQSEEVAERIEVGTVPPTEAAAARSEVALREQALIDARSELNAARLQLLRLMNAPLQSALERPLEPTSSAAAAQDRLEDVQDRVTLALQLRPDLNEARLRLDQDRLETIRTRNGLLPRLDLFIALGKTGYADTFTDSFRELDGDTYDATVGFELSQHVGQSAAKGRHLAALATRRQSALAVDNLAQLIELDVLLAVNEARRAREQIDATITTRQLQEQTVEAETARFDVGASTTLLVAQAQRDLLEAQIAELEAVTNHRIALIRLYLAEGSLLERRGVTLDP